MPDTRRKSVKIRGKIGASALNSPAASPRSSPIPPTPTSASSDKSRPQLASNDEHQRSVHFMHTAATYNLARNWVHHARTVVHSKKDDDGSRVTNYFQAADDKSKERNILVENRNLDENIAIRLGGLIKHDLFFSHEWASRVDQAAAYVRDSGKGRYEHGEGAMFWKPAWQRRLFRFHQWSGWRHFVNLMCFLLLFLTFFERPVPGAGVVENESIVAAVEGCVVVLLNLDHVMHFTWYGSPRKWFSKPHHALNFVSCFLLFLDWIIAVSTSFTTVRFGRVFRGLSVVFYSATLRKVFSVLARTIPKPTESIALYGFVTYIYAMIGSTLLSGLYVDFPNDGDGLLPSNFDDFFEASRSLFILTTSENYPAVMLPAYHQSPFYLIYFWSYFFLSSWVIMSLLTAIIVNVFRSIHGHDLVRNRVKERKALIAAFGLLDQEDAGVIGYPEWSQLMYNLHPHSLPEVVQLLFDTCDRDGSGKITVTEFFELVDILRMQISVEMERIPTESQEKMKRLLRKPWMLWAWRLLVVSQGLILAMYHKDLDADTELLLVILDNICLGMFVFEGLFKIVAKGFKKYWNRSWNKFELTLTLLSVTCKIFAATVNTDQLNRMSQAFAALRLLRLIPVVPTLKALAQPLVHIMAVMLDFGRAIFILLYIFAVFGLAMFHDVYVPYDEEFPEGESPIHSFDGFSGAAMVMVQMFTTSNWHHVVYSAIEARHKSSSTLFVVFYFVVSLFVVNIFVAIALITFKFHQETSKVRFDIAQADDDDHNEHEDDAVDAGESDDASEEEPESSNAPPKTTQSVASATGTNSGKAGMLSLPGARDTGAGGRIRRSIIVEHRRDWGQICAAGEDSKEEEDSKQLQAVFRLKQGQWQKEKSALLDRIRQLEEECGTRETAVASLLHQLDDVETEDYTELSSLNERTSVGGATPKQMHPSRAASLNTISSWGSMGSDAVEGNRPGQTDNLSKVRVPSRVNEEGSDDDSVTLTSGEGSSTPAMSLETETVDSGISPPTVLSPMETLPSLPEVN